MRDRVRKYLKRVVRDGGEYRGIEQCISLDCPLSPRLGALYTMVRFLTWTLN